MSKTPTRSTVASEAPGSHRVVHPGHNPQAQLALLLDAENERKNADSELQKEFRQWVNEYGGADALRAALGEKDSYLSKITDAMVGTRPIQARWIVELQRDERVAAAVASYFNRKAGGSAPLDRGDVAEAVLQIVMENPGMWEWMRAEVARRRGVRPAQVRP